MPRPIPRPAPRATAPAASRGRPVPRGRGESYSKSTPPKPRSRPDRHERRHSPSHSSRKDRGRARSSGVKRSDDDEYGDIFKHSDNEADRDYGYGRTYSPPPRRDTRDRGRSRGRDPSPGYEYIQGPLDRSPSPRSNRRGSGRRHSSQPRDRKDRPSLHSRKSQSATPTSRRDRVMSGLKDGWNAPRERDYPDKKDFGRTKSSGSRDKPRSKSQGPSRPLWLNYADAALDAGLLAVYRHRREPGAWVGAKGARVATAALGAAALDAFIQRDGDRSGFRKSAEATVGGMLLNKMVGGQDSHSKVFF